MSAQERERNTKYGIRIGVFLFLSVYERDFLLRLLDFERHALLTVSVNKRILSFENCREMAWKIADANPTEMRRFLSKYQGKKTVFREQVTFKSKRQLGTQSFHTWNKNEKSA